MKRILFASSYTGLGGGETATLTLAENLHGYEPHLFTTAEGAFAAAWRKRGWVAHIHPYRGASAYFLPALWALLPVSRTLEKTIHDNNIDIVHSDYHSLPMALPAARRAGVPIVWTCMGWWFRPKPWQRKFFRSVDTTFAHSEIIKRGFLGTPPFMPPENIEVTYPGVDTFRFTPRVDGTPIQEEIGVRNSPIVTMIGRFQHVKGHDTFISMASHVMERLPRAHFIIAGANAQTPADVSYQRKIMRRVQNSHRLSTHTHFLGHRDNIEVVIAASDVIVCPSHFESFGVLNIEAMASGKPVVSTNLGGPTEVVVDGVTGFLVPPKDPKALADRVIELLYSESTRRSFGAAGRMRAQQVFSAGATAEIVLAHLDELLLAKTSL
jgi:glycosyltransferase involved in cell wall biosynthesis